MAKAKAGARTRGQGRPTSEESQQLDEKIRLIALELFMEQGFDGVSMEAVATKAGVSKRTLYARYGDKRELFSDVLRWSRVEWSQNAIEVAAPAGVSLEEKLIAIGDALLAQSLMPRYIKLARIAATKSDEFREEMHQGFTMSLSPRISAISTVLQLHQEMGEINVKDPEVAAELFIGLITGIPIRLAGFGILRDPNLERSRIRYAVDLFLNGLRVEKERASTVGKRSSRVTRK